MHVTLEGGRCLHIEDLRELVAQLEELVRLDRDNDC